MPPKEPRKGRYHGPEYPDDGDGFEDHERVSEEDVQSLIDAHLGPIDHTERRIPTSDLLSIKEFLTDLKVRDVGLAEDKHFEYLWRRLQENPTFVQDFSYVVMDINTQFQLSKFPLPVSVSHLLRYAQDYDNSEGFRLWFINTNTAPNLSKLGFGEESVKTTALSDYENRRKAAEATRFLGWVVGQPCMEGLSHKIEDFKKRALLPEETFNLNHLARLVTLEVIDQIDVLRKMSKRIEGQPLQEQGQPRLSDATDAMEGIRNLCDRFLLGVESN
jgi:hypothetical protein